ncbi:hypothetical protein DFP72DRAFT_898642 [Ephemerocybe angulata]|uniref:Uncharacterized protein n=1 Tax=Ephemerocybe angulata TaxID=980116 RepID=A0A8H6M794_9AGAR|nr:hypothetical protein DFP72DRAFT_898642 [Tulosesus angulatus]
MAVPVASQSCVTLSGRLFLLSGTRALGEGAPKRYIVFSPLKLRGRLTSTSMSQARSVIAAAEGRWSALISVHERVSPLEYRPSWNILTALRIVWTTSSIEGQSS